MTIGRLSLKTEANFPHNHVLSTHVVKLKESDWLQMKCLDVGINCKQSHVVKHSNALSIVTKNKPMWVLMQYACISGHMTKMPNIKAYSMGTLTHN